MAKTQILGNTLKIRIPRLQIIFNRIYKPYRVRALIANCNCAMSTTLCIEDHRSPILTYRYKPQSHVAYGLSSDRRSISPIALSAYRYRNGPGGLNNVRCIVPMRYIYISPIHRSDSSHIAICLCLEFRYRSKAYL